LNSLEHVAKRKTGLLLEVKRMAHPENCAKMENIEKAYLTVLRISLKGR
jgi:hypothetical protein